MHKILVLTDLHLTAGEAIIDLDPALRFLEVYHRAIDDHPDATRLILTGDLTHHGTTEQYEALKTLLADCPIPITYMLGNHDRRAPFRATFPNAPTDENGFVQSVIDLPGWRLIALDTLDDPPPAIRHSGSLCEKRMAYLERALDVEAGTRTVVFTHHHAFTSGFNGMDSIALRNAPALIDALNGRCEMLVSGHIHRTISASIGGLPNVVFKSPCHQMPLALGDTHHSLSVDEPGAYGLLLLSDEGVIAHSQDILPDATVYSEESSR